MKIGSGGVEVAYAADVDGQDRVVHEAAELSPDVKIRLALTVYRDQQYQAWPGQSWTIRGTAQQAIDVRDALKAFAAAIERKPAEAVARLLDLA